MAPTRGKTERQVAKGGAVGNAAVLQLSAVWSLDPQVGLSSYKTVVSEGKREMIRFHQCPSQEGEL